MTFSFKEKTKQSIILVIRWKTVVTVLCHGRLRDFRRKFKIDNWNQFSTFVFGLGINQSITLQVTKVPKKEEEGPYVKAWSCSPVLCGRGTKWAFQRPLFVVECFARFLSFCYEFGYSLYCKQQDTWLLTRRKESATSLSIVWLIGIEAFSSVSGTFISVIDKACSGQVMAGCWGIS